MDCKAWRENGLSPRSLYCAKAAAKTPAVLAKSLPRLAESALGSRAKLSRSQGETRASMNCHGLFIPLGRRWSCKPSLETGRCPILKVKGNSAISRMKVAFLCPSLSRTSFGIFETQRRLAQCLQELRETEVEVFGPQTSTLIATAINGFPLIRIALRRSDRVRFAILRTSKGIF